MSLRVDRGTDRYPFEHQRFHSNDDDDDRKYNNYNYIIILYTSTMVQLYTIAVRICMLYTILL